MVSNLICQQILASVEEAQDTPAYVYLLLTAPQARQLKWSLPRVRGKGEKLFTSTKALKAALALVDKYNPNYKKYMTHYVKAPFTAFQMVSTAYYMGRDENDDPKWTDVPCKDFYWVQGRKRCCLRASR